MATIPVGFGCAAESAADLHHAAALVESLRRFGGELAEQPFWVLMPTAVAIQVKEQAVRLTKAGGQVVPLDTSATPMELPFSTKTLGAAVAESMAASEMSLLVWMDTGSLVVSQPLSLILPPDTVFGYRPVDHTLIGSPHAAPADAFWQQIYDRCATPLDQLFAMPTTVDERILRPYFNAGLMVVRPERRIFGAWLGNFTRLQQDEVFVPFLTQRIYRVFFHQAVLAATVLSLLDRSEMALLPPSVSYPLHMHGQYPLARRARSLDQLTTLRHEGLFDQPGWRERLGISVGAELSSWLAARFPQARKDDPV